MEHFEKLAAKLSELFELEKADLDFGIHRIIKARQQHIRIFLGLDDPSADDPGAPTLKKIVEREMGELNTADLERQLDASAEKIKTAYGTRAFDDSGHLADGPAKESPDGQTWFRLREALDGDNVVANAQLEAEIYSHLTEFFSRYYDEADFLSKRRIKAGDAPYAVPYSGEEVMLHWANKDQYYIKSSKDLKDYTFTLPEQFGGKRVQFKCQRQDPVLNNNNAKREFHLDEEAEIDAGKDTLVIPFHFRIVDKTRTKPQTAAWIKHILKQLPAEWRQALAHTPEGAANNLLTRHLANYTRKNESDFFIHKHLKKFLDGELDFYIKNEVMHLDDIDEKSTGYLATRVRLIVALRTIARHIITFLAQLENFQKKLWLKKKYVTETQYCFTLDRLIEHAPELLADVLEGVERLIPRHDGEMRSQRDEWVKLYAIDELEDYPEGGGLTEEFLRANDKMMVDTVFYPESFKWKLLEAIPDIDESLDGLLIHSENFQALNLLQERYRERVKCVYIDPPYNTELDRKSGDFLYKDGYTHSTWCSLIENSLEIARSGLSEDGALVCSLDDHEQHKLRMLLSRAFGEANFIATIAVRSRSSVSSDHDISLNHNYLTFYRKSEKNVFGGFKLDPGDYSNPDDDQRGPWKPVPLDANKPGGETYYPITNPNTGREYFPPNGRSWAINREAYEKLYDDERICFGLTGDSAPKRKLFYNERITKGDRDTPISIWPDCETTQKGTRQVMALFGFKAFKYPKPTGLISDAIFITDLQQDTLVLDYFAGSGTTAHAVINLNREDNGSRKYILVEMGDHFDTVLKPRIQKVAYSKEWKDGKPKAVPGEVHSSPAEQRATSNEQRATSNEQRATSNEQRATSNEQRATSNFAGISHAFKYFRLESYEDALNNLDLGEDNDRTPDLLGLDDSVREEYLFSYLLDVETRGHLLNLDRFRDPWACRLKIHDPHTGKSEARTVDLIETFNYLLGLTVAELRVRDGFLTIEGENPEGGTVLVIWRKTAGQDGGGGSDWPATTNDDLRAFAEKKLRLNPADTEYHAIYVNGDHTLEDPHSKIHVIEEVFYERMFENTGNPGD